MRNDFEKAMHFRHACKAFDEARQIPSHDLEFVLEAGRMSPSSLGLEHWNFLVIKEKAVREKIRELAWGQPQVTSCSALVAVLYKKQLRTEVPYTRERFKQNFGLDEIPEGYRNFIDSKSAEELHNWSAKQTYIAAANMMTAAAYIGIDSCPMEGFDYPAVEKLLGIDTERYGIAMLLPLGYRSAPQPGHSRMPLSELISYF